MKFKFLIIFLLLIFLSGCKDTTPRVFLSTKPITKETFKPMDQFKVNDSINFVVIAPKGFRTETIRLQLLKKSMLSPIYGYTLAFGKDYNAENDYYLTGAFTVYSAGRYELYVYDLNEKKKKTHFPAKQYDPYPKPLAVVQFGVTN